jgi:hypothetical protein
VLADSRDQPPDRVVLTTLTDCHGNVAQAWRQLSSGGWRMQSLSAFRRRATRLLATHPAPLPDVRRDTDQPASAPSSAKPRGHQNATGDVLVVAIDVTARDVISSWVIPNPSLRSSQIQASVREALSLRSHLMLDLAEFAKHSTR